MGDGFQKRKNIVKIAKTIVESSVQTIWFIPTGAGLPYTGSRVAHAGDIHAAKLVAGKS